MGRRELLRADDHAKLFGIPAERDALARSYNFGPGDLALTDMTSLVTFVAEQTELSIDRPSANAKETIGAALVRAIGDLDI